MCAFFPNTHNNQKLLRVRTSNINSFKYKINNKINAYHTSIVCRVLTGTVKRTFSAGFPIYQTDPMSFRNYSFRKQKKNPRLKYVRS